MRQYDRLVVEIHRDRAELGQLAAQRVARDLAETIGRQGEARVVFACAPSQDEFLAALASSALVDWSKVTAFHMDEYVGIEATNPASFRSYLQRHFLGRLSIGRFFPLHAELPDRARVCREYSGTISAAPIDLICMGIGENGHIAFNDPPVADFDDPVLVKEVELDEACRRQQVNDDCFPTLSQVPKHAFTLTVPVFRQARQLSIHVPGPRKAQAVRETLLGPIATACPASILRTHPNATLHLDRESAGLLPPH